MMLSAFRPNGLPDTLVLGRREPAPDTGSWLLSNDWAQGYGWGVDSQGRGSQNGETG